MISNLIMASMVVLAFLMLFIAICSLAGKCKTKKEIEIEKILQKSLEDEYIIDPETGIKITLEEAETGDWNTEDEREKIKIKDIPYEKDRQIETILKYFKENKIYKNEELSIEQMENLKRSYTLGKYEDCSFNHSFTFNKGRALIIVPIYKKSIHFSPESSKSFDEQLLFWLSIKKSDCEFYYNGSEILNSTEDCETKIQMKELLSEIQKLNEITIEINNGNLYIKTTKLATLEDVYDFERITKTVTNTLYIL